MQYVAVRLPHSAEIKLQLSRQRNDLKYLKSLFWELVVIEAMLPIFFLHPILFSEKQKIKSKLTISRKSPIFLPSSFSLPVINSALQRREEGKKWGSIGSSSYVLFFPFFLGRPYGSRKKTLPSAPVPISLIKEEGGKKEKCLLLISTEGGRKRGFFPLLQSSVRIGFGKPPTTLSPFWIAMCSYSFCLSVKGSAEAQRNWWSPLLPLFLYIQKQTSQVMPKSSALTLRKKKWWTHTQMLHKHKPKRKKNFAHAMIWHKIARGKEKMKTYLFFFRARKVCGKRREGDRNCISASASALFSFFATTDVDAAAAAAADSSNDLRPLLFPLGNYCAIGAFLLLFLFVRENKWCLTPPPPPSALAADKESVINFLFLFF